MSHLPSTLALRRYSAMGAATTPRVPTATGVQMSVLDESVESHARELRGRVTRLSTSVACHAPADQPFAMEALARPDDPGDRWGTPGKHTIFLASDPGVALAELARHREPNAEGDERRIMRLELATTTVLDLRSEDVLAVLGVPSIFALLDREVARELSRQVREASISAGLVVPSMAFLDRPDRFNVILFAEAVGDDLGSLLHDVREAGKVAMPGPG